MDSALRCQSLCSLVSGRKSWKVAAQNTAVLRRRVAHQGGPCGGERVLEAQALSLGWDIPPSEVVAMLLAGGPGSAQLGP